MILYNYSSLSQRDTKIYDIGGYQIPGGFSINFLKVVGPVFLVINIIGAIIGAIFRISYLNPFSDRFIPAYTITWLILGIAIGCGLWYIQFAGYRLYQYLIAYFKPKKVYTNEFRLTEVKLTNIKIRAFIRNIL